MPLGMMMHLANNFSERRWWKRETEKVQALLQLEKYLEKFTSDQGINGRFLLLPLVSLISKYELTSLNIWKTQNKISRNVRMVMWFKIFSCLLDQKFMDICFERYGNVHFGNTFRKIRVNYSAMKFNIYQVIITFYACLLWHTLSYVCIAITNPLLYYLFYVRFQRRRRTKKRISLVEWLCEP